MHSLNTTAGWHDYCFSTNTRVLEFKPRVYWLIICDKRGLICFIWKKLVAVNGCTDTLRDWHTYFTVKPLNIIAGYLIQCAICLSNAILKRNWKLLEVINYEVISNYSLLIIETLLYDLGLVCLMKLLFKSDFINSTYAGSTFTIFSSPLYNRHS